MATRVFKEVLIQQKSCRVQIKCLLGILKIMRKRKEKNVICKHEKNRTYT